MATELDRETVLALIRAHGNHREQLLSILLDLQNAAPDHRVGEDACRLVAGELGLAPSRVYDAITFYAMLHGDPQAAVTVEVCDGAPCAFSHGPKAAGLVERVLGVRPGETTADGRFAVRAVPCFGACDRAPAVRINEKIYGPLDESALRDLLKEVG